MTRRVKIGEAHYLIEIHPFQPLIGDLSQFQHLKTGQEPPLAYVWDDVYIRKSTLFTCRFWRVHWPLNAPLFVSSFDQRSRVAIREDIFGSWEKSGNQSGKILEKMMQDGISKIEFLDGIYRFSWFKGAPNYIQKLQPKPRKQAASISVVCNYRDHAKLTLRFLQSLAEQKTQSKLELILVNNQSELSQQNTIKTWVEEHLPATINVKFLDYNAQFNHSVQTNMGVLNSSGEVIVVANNDSQLIQQETLQVLADWSLEPMIASVGPQFINENGGLVSAGIQIVEDNSGQIFRESQESLLKESTRETSGNSFALAAIKRSTWEQIGGLNEVEFPTQYNDADFNLRAAELGFRHIYVGSQQVIHSPGGSERRSLDQLSDLQQKLWRTQNRRELKAKTNSFFTEELSSRFF